ncbi:hypothetical protein WN55_01479 [Dufourea novaeangliae]|uniref:Uncharacterized protein n=1 Tax=Dufourea novaeangliae TaxID=178035 RepID=A0A154PET7_DUFNO|nr:hypothetical protein WN55_01479 [Dufourea novaeangliae]
MDVSEDSSRAWSRQLGQEKAGSSSVHQSRVAGCIITHARLDDTRAVSLFIRPSLKHAGTVPSCFLLVSGTILSVGSHVAGVEFPR